MSDTPTSPDHCPSCRSHDWQLRLSVALPPSPYSGGVVTCGDAWHQQPPTPMPPRSGGDPWAKLTRYGVQQNIYFVDDVDAARAQDQETIQRLEAELHNWRSTTDPRYIPLAVEAVRLAQARAEQAEASLAEREAQIRALREQWEDIVRAHEGMERAATSRHKSFAAYCIANSYRSCAKDLAALAATPEEPKD